MFILLLAGSLAAVIGHSQYPSSISNLYIFRWLIRAQGSQYCWNSEVCAERWNGFAWFLMSSNHTREWISNTEHDVEGVFDFFLKAFGAINVDPILNPLWHNWNHVYMWSCSSDAFMGDAPPCEAPLPPPFSAPHLPPLSLSLSGLRKVGHFVGPLQ